MKKIIAQIITIVFVLAILTSSIYAASFTATLTSNKSTVRPGDEIELTFAVKDINMEGGISSSILGKLVYNEDIFEPVTKKNFSMLVDGYIGGYNNEETEQKGNFIAIISDNITEAEPVFKIKLKVKEGISNQSATVTISQITTTPEVGEEIVGAQDASVIVNISNQVTDDKNPGEDNNPSGDNNNQGGDNNNPGGNTNNPNGSNNQGGTSNGGKDNTGYQSGNLPKTGTNANMIIAIGVVLAIGVGSLIKYEKMK